jgi:hypothetical protein
MTPSCTEIQSDTTSTSCVGIGSSTNGPGGDTWSRWQKYQLANSTRYSSSCTTIIVVMFCMSLLNNYSVLAAATPQAQSRTHPGPGPDHRQSDGPGDGRDGDASILYQVEWHVESSIEISFRDWLSDHIII